MAVIAVPYDEPWIVARWAFELLLHRLLDSCTSDGDRSTIERAIALSGLHLDLLPEGQRTRLAEALATEADKQRLEISTAHPPLPDPEGLARALADLEMRLHDVFER